MIVWPGAGPENICYVGGSPTSYRITIINSSTKRFIGTFPGARFNKEVQPTRSLNLYSELTYSEMGNSEFSVTEQLNCVSLLNSK